MNYLYYVVDDLRQKSWKQQNTIHSTLKAALMHYQMIPDTAVKSIGIVSDDGGESLEIARCLQLYSWDIAGQPVLPMDAFYPDRWRNDERAMKIVKKIISILLAVFLAFSVLGIAVAAETAVVSYDQPFDRGVFDSSENRIPALITLNNGAVMAAIDMRYKHGSDSPNNIDTLVYVEPNDTTVMEFSFINSICIHGMEAVEVLDKRVEDDFTYYKYKIKLPISYNDFDTAIYFVQERAAVTVNGTSYYLPVPFIETSLVNDVRHTRPDVYKNGKRYSCTLLDLSMGISCAEKTIVGKTSFHVLQEK